MPLARGHAVAPVLARAFGEDEAAQEFAEL
jgi:hypothetical protein